MRRTPEGKGVIQASLEKHLDFYKRYEAHEAIEAAVIVLTQLPNPYVNWGGSTSLLMH